MYFSRSPVRSEAERGRRRKDGPSVRPWALEGRFAANGYVFDVLAEDYFSVVGSSDESEPEHGLTDDSDTDDGEDKRDEGGGFNFDDLDDAEFMDNESGDNRPQEVAKCSNAVDHSRVTLPRLVGRVPACLATVHPVLGLALTTCLAKD